MGKSSLINALLGSNQAKVSQTPGRTRAINFFAIADSPTRQQPRWIFADLPGYGYAKISKSISAEWPSFIDPYLTNRETLALCICLVDSNIPVQRSDAQLIEFLASVGRRYLVVGTKADRLSGNARVKAEKALREGLGIERMLLCSAETKRGIQRSLGRDQRGGPGRCAAWRWIVIFVPIAPDAIASATNVANCSASSAVIWR